MAEQKKNGSSKASAKKNSSPAPAEPPKKEAAPKSKPIAEPKNEKNQFWSVLLFATGILVILMSLIEGTSGWNKIHNLLLGLFGAAVFFVPIILIYTSVLIGMEKSQKCVTGRAVWGGALTLLTSSAIQIVFVGEIRGRNLGKQIVNLYEAGKELKGGGVLSMIIAGPLMGIFGPTGAKIIAGIMFFVFIMLLTNLGLLQFFELLTRPFKFLVQCFLGLKNVLTGGDFEDAFDDDDEADDLEAEMEAIELANNHSKEEKEPVKKSKKKKDEDDAFDFLFDVPLPNENNNHFEKPDIPKPIPPVNAEKTPTDDLDTLINKAVDEKDKMNEKALAEASNIAEAEPVPEKVYEKPSLSLLEIADNRSNAAEASAEMREKADTIVNAMKSFGVTVRISGILRGPSVTRYEIQPGAGVKIKTIKNLDQDLALYLAAKGLRIEAPVPGKAVIGVEVANDKKDMVTLREILASTEFQNSRSKLTFALGKDIAGNIILGDVAKMPHIIIAGTTGSGKSVCTRSIIMSILYNATPDEVKLILIDPKIVEFKVFDGIPHLLIPIVTEAKKAAGALAWAVTEMMRRYNIFADNSVNDLASYNSMAECNPEMVKLPQIVVFIDELADMMLVAGKEVEESICRLAQMGRAAGMHLVVATQRPTTDVITGLIKANIPSRIALSVMSQIDSRTIIDTQGAEKLLGNGDMLYLPIGSNYPVRIQGCFASSKDVKATVDFVKAQGKSEFDNEIVQAVENYVPAAKGSKGGDTEGSVSVGSDEDYVERAIAVAVESGQLSTSMLQRKLKLGYARAARIMDELEELGVIGPSEGAKPRRVLMSRMQYDERRTRMAEN